MGEITSKCFSPESKCIGTHKYQAEVLETHSIILCPSSSSSEFGDEKFSACHLWPGILWPITLLMSLVAISPKPEEISFDSNKLRFKEGLKSRVQMLNDDMVLLH